MAIFQPPPTYTLPIEETEENGRKVTKFSRIWLKWFYDLVAQLNLTAPAGNVAGATNTIAKFTGANTVGNSGVTDDGVTVLTSEIMQAGGFKSSDGSPGITATITTAKLTGGGANGAMTFKNGLLTAQTQAT